MTYSGSVILRDFHGGCCTHAYEYFGCHAKRVEKGYIYTFRVWAPRAAEVTVVGNKDGACFSEKMERVTDDGVYECMVSSPSSLDGGCYRYRITGGNGVCLKADPYAAAARRDDIGFSVIRDDRRFSWNDAKWQSRRRETVGIKDNEDEFLSSPLNIYELHLGSWKTKNGARPNEGGYLNYREIADELCVYVKQLGYTHVEPLPIAEHPYDGSWGYQISGFYAPTSRYGDPDDFRYFVNKMHENGIGVILDFVPAHFARDEYGLADFDGEPLYEYDDPDRREHKVWGTRYFDITKNEVVSFLLSNALYLIREYHIDGLRVDAVSTMLYTDFEQVGSLKDGSNSDPAAAKFFVKLNRAVKTEFPDVLMIAEESGTFPIVTKPCDRGGLGFDLRWNMGWANDGFAYIKEDPFFRKYHHSKLTFPIMYAYDERFILPISHDEVVHGKKSLLDKNFGDYMMKFAGFRAFLAYQMTYPGKKLMFMGCEFAPFREWSCKEQLEWFMTDFPMHKYSLMYTAELNRFYLNEPALWERDFSRPGFEWIYPDLDELNIIAFKRLDAHGNEIVVLINFAPVDREGFVVEGLRHDRYKEIFSSDETRFGGEGRLNEGVIGTVKGTDGRYSALLTLPGLTACILKPTGWVNTVNNFDKI